ncbi:MAG: response regulator [Chloroflexi bacterium]|nr:response regulator [Chloroflexota bacterium]MBI3733757.1 response regulator [Chloroflexota bacterium]
MDDPTRILLAEDEAIERNDLHEMLTGLGYAIAGEADGGASAVRLARELKPDIVIMDIEMPDMDGLTAAKVLWEEKVCPVLILTAYSQPDFIERACQAGVMGYLVKPFLEAEVGPAIDVALARYQEHRELEGEVKDLSEKFETRKLLDRAKGILMDTKGLSEAEAFRRIQKMSMNMRRPMKEIAQAIVITSEARP